MANGNNFFSKVAADTLGLSDIGKIISPKDFDKVDGDDYIMHEDGEKIFYVIKSKTDEYVFTNKGLIHVDGTSALSKKRLVERYDFHTNKVSDVKIETAGTVDLDVELKFTIGHKSFSIDVDKKELESLKDLYKALVEIHHIQNSNEKSYNNGLLSLDYANKTLSKCRIEGNEIAKVISDINEYNFNWLQNLKTLYDIKDFSSVYEKYINN